MLRVAGLESGDDAEEKRIQKSASIRDLGHGQEGPARQGQHVLAADGLRRVLLGELAFVDASTFPEARIGYGVPAQVVGEKTKISVDELDPLVAVLEAIRADVLVEDEAASRFERVVDERVETLEPRDVVQHVVGDDDVEGPRRQRIVLEIDDAIVDRALSLALGLLAGAFHRLLREVAGHDAADPAARRGECPLEPPGSAAQHERAPHHDRQVAETNPRQPVAGGIPVAIRCRYRRMSGEAVQTSDSS